MRTLFSCLALAVVLLCPGAPAQWLHTNGPYGGRLIRVACDSSGVLYATHDGRGVFRSTDDGLRWHPASEGITRLRMNVIATNSAGIVFVASYLGGIFRSSDHGSVWHTCHPALPDTNTTILAVCRRSVYVGTSKHYSPGGGGRLFRSTDDGDTWSPISPTWTRQSVNAIAANGSGTIITGLDSSMYRSTDDGTSWVRVRGTSDTTYTSIVFDGQGRVYAAATRSISLKGHVLRSTDDGATWHTMTSGLPDVRIGELLVHPSGVILAATLGSGVFRSSDHGQMWYQCNGGLTTRDIWGLGMNRAGDLLAATWDGVFSSSNGGDDWTRGSEGIDATSVYCLALNEAGRVFAGVEDGGIFCSDDNGTVWRQINAGMPGDSFWNKRVNWIATGPTAGVLAATENGLFRSTNAGEFWSQLDLGFPSPRVSEVVVSPFGTIVASVVSAGLLRSTNDGLTWMQVGQPGISISSALAANSSGHIFAGFYDLAGGGITRSTDHGVSWSPLPLGVTYFTPRALTIDAHDNIIAASGYRILRSTDNGTTWVPTSMPSFNISVLALAVDSSGRIYAGGWDYSAATSATVQVSTDNGATWDPMNAGLAGDFVNALIVDPLGFVLAGMSEYGVFRSTVSTSVGEHYSGPGRCALLQNYPNPFNPTTTIEFRVQNSELTILKVFDLLGREIATLVNEVKEPGTYAVQWDANGVSTGVYFGRLKVGDFVQTKRMMVVK